VTGIAVDRGRFVRTLTFWLRPAFVLRVLNRFQLIAGFDRAMALASSALTAMIPLLVLAGAVLPHVQAEHAAQWLIDRYGLTGGGAEAVKDALAPATATNTDVSLIGALLLVIAILSFARGVQRLFERTWELRPLSVRNTVNDLLWIAGLIAYLVISGVVHREIGNSRVQVGANVLLTPLTALFLVWSGRVLSARRIAFRDLLPFSIVASLALAVYFAGAAVYVPHLFSSYAGRYGVIGAVFAMISALFGFMVALVASAALGREVFDELARIRAGERPPHDEVRREWDVFVREARSRWRTVRGHVDRIRRNNRTPLGGGSAESGGPPADQHDPDEADDRGDAHHLVGLHPAVEAADGGGRAVGVDRVPGDRDLDESELDQREHDHGAGRGEQSITIPGEAPNSEKVERPREGKQPTDHAGDHE
jgi:membrane protein